MVLNKSKGNMYGFVTHTWNPIKGKCVNDCEYCYMKRFPQKEVRLVESEIKDDLGNGNFIFVGSSTDMFARNIKKDWIMRVLNACKAYKGNKYLFQSKNPKRMAEFMNFLPKDSVVATTIETNRLGFNYCAPSVSERKFYIQQDKYPVMITIEPIMDFDLDLFADWMKEIMPFQVAIGADSKNSGLREPGRKKVLGLVSELEKFTKVVQKKNLNRLLKK